MIINTVIHSHDLAAVISKGYTVSEMPAKTYRIKFNGKFIRIKTKSEWDKLGSAKSAFKAFLRRNRYMFDQYVNQGTPYHSSNYYRCDTNDMNNIYNQLIADNVLEFVEITN